MIEELYVGMFLKKLSTRVVPQSLLSKFVLSYLLTTCVFGGRRWWWCFHSALQILKKCNLDRDC